VPAFIVPNIETTGFAEGTTEAKALGLDALSHIDSPAHEVLPLLDAFVAAFESWVVTQLRPRASSQRGNPTGR